LSSDYEAFTCWELFHQIEGCYMKHQTNWQKRFITFVLLILLISACKIFSPSAVPFKPGDPTATPLGSDLTDPNYIKGVDAFYANRDEEVIQLMSAVIEANPNLAPPYQYRGRAYWVLQDCHAGLADEEKALSINPNYAAAWASRGLIYACLGSDEQALEDFQRALSIDPSLAFAHENLGFYYYKHGEYEKSLEEYNLSAAIDPNRAGAWTGKAQALTQLGQYDQCITYASKAIEIDVEKWIAYTNRAFCEQALGSYTAAIQDYKTYLKHNATDADVWYNLGSTQHDAGLSQEGVISLSKALELNPNYYDANINRGLAYIDFGKYAEALADFNQALKFSNNPTAYSGRGTAYYGLGRYDDAIADLELATRMMPNRPHAYCVLALAYFKVGRYQDTIDTADTLNQIAPGCGGEPLIVVQAKSYYSLGEYEKGLAFTNKIFEMGQHYAIQYYLRGIMYQAMGKNEDAVSDLTMFISTIQQNNNYTEEIADAKKRLAELKP
jgi:tetratricopeptide (TPR) repeat protein